MLRGSAAIGITASAVTSGQILTVGIREKLELH
jgi:hypothetical protein